MDWSRVRDPVHVCRAWRDLGLAWRMRMRVAWRMRMRVTGRRMVFVGMLFVGMMFVGCSWDILWGCVFVNMVLE